MCILLWTLNNHPTYKFIFAGNRDEFLQRPTLYADFWPAPHTTVLAGRDLQFSSSNNGTWLGISTKGKFAALTYYREFPILLSTDVTSRGILVRDFLTGEQGVQEYLNTVEEQKDRFGGFSLLTLDLSAKNSNLGDQKKWEMGYFSNREGTEVTELKEKVVHGLSNSVYANPWPKVTFGCSIMQEILDRNITDENELITELFKLLGNSEPYTDPEISTLEYDISQLAIRRDISDLMPDRPYATRTSTVVLVDYDGNVVFVERNWWVFKDGKWVEVEDEDRLFRLRIGEEEKVVEEVGLETL